MYIWIFLVPIAAKILSRVEDVATITIFGYTFSIPLSLPFSWKVFYFSAICFAFGNLLHKLRCPKLILDHPTYSTFREEGKPDWHLRDYAGELGIDFDRFKENLEDNMAEYGERVKKGETYSQSLFWHIYWDVDSKRMVSFAVTLCFYVVGFCLIGYVVFENLVWVTKYLIGSF